MSLRLGSIKRSESLLYQNTEEVLAKELKRLEKEEKTKKQKLNVFLTENEETLEDLVKNAPLKFEYFPSKTVMHKLIIKAT